MQTAISTSYRRDLGDGLVLRWSTAEDTERIATLHSMVHRDKVEEPPNTNVKRVIHRLMNGDHPLMGPNDFGVIEDTGKEGNPVVACTCLWKHTWAYEGIPFSVGRPEMVATDPAYRNRGLIRALFEMVHERSEAKGDLVQAITGIARAIASNFWNWLYKLRHNEPTFKALLYKCALQATRKFRCDCPVGGMNTQCSDGKQGKEEMKT
ncbi:MAG: GNAT family N-acetyltransferase [Ktedonobacteraceae bacterium]